MPDRNPLSAIASIFKKAAPKIENFPGRIDKPEHFFGYVAKYALLQKACQLQGCSDFRKFIKSAERENYKHALNWLDQSKFGNRNEKYEMEELVAFLELRAGEENTIYGISYSEADDIKRKQAENEKRFWNYALNIPAVKKKIDQAGGTAFLVRAEYDQEAARMRTKIFLDTVNTLPASERRAYDEFEKGIDERHAQLKKQYEEKMDQASKAFRLRNMLNGALKHADKGDFSKTQESQQTIAESFIGK